MARPGVENVPTPCGSIFKLSRGSQLPYNKNSKIHKFPVFAKEAVPYPDINTNISRSVSQHFPMFRQRINVCLFHFLTNSLSDTGLVHGRRLKRLQKRHSPLIQEQHMNKNGKLPPPRGRRRRRRRRKIFPTPPAPTPSRPGIQYPVRAPLTPI